MPQRPNNCAQSVPAQGHQMEYRPHPSKYLKDIPCFHDNTVPGKTPVVFFVNEHEPARHRNEAYKEVRHSEACYKAVGARAQIGILDKRDDYKCVRQNNGDGNKAVEDTPDNQRSHSN
ncbi:hypothetical protein OS493_029173 [Desmophyllum pertusum]|uniref:Uncharacterized protein n=1 Tax=Desmophyllum pertusum TaxID=174260 RepID=A0A9W9ZZ41_9CNID|nr:hypothetical protein OS493_029173 [Desmophyllum pertusum]